MLVLGLAALAWIIARGVAAPRRGAATRPARRDLAVAVPLAASWFGLWGLYAAYDWTAGPGPDHLAVRPLLRRRHSAPSRCSAAGC